jgi:hypothetical protein
MAGPERMDRYGRIGADAEVPMGLRIECVSIDAADPEALGRFWAEALGWEDRMDEDGDVWVEPGEGHALRGRCAPLLCIAVPDGKRSKNRLHLDLVPDDQEVEVERLLALGASKPDIGQSGTESWVVLADPEGNEFCVLDEI